MMFEPFVFEKTKKEGTGSRNLLYYAALKEKDLSGYISAKSFPDYKNLFEKHLEHLKEKKQNAATYKNNFLKKAAYFGLAGISFFVVAGAAIYLATSKIEINLRSTLNDMIYDMLFTPKGINTTALLAASLYAAPVGCVYTMSSGEQLVKYFTFNKHVDSHIQNDENVLSLLKKYEEKNYKKFS